MPKRFNHETGGWGLESPPRRDYYPITLNSYAAYRDPRIEASLQDRSRIQFSLSAQKYEHIGPWYEQTHATCVSHAIANAGLALGRELDETDLMDLIHLSASGASTFHFVQERFNQSRAQIRLLKEDPREITYLGTTSILSRIISEARWPVIVPAQSGVDLDKLIEEYGYWIIGTMSAGRKPVISVRADTFYSKADRKQHALCVS